MKVGDLVKYVGSTGILYSAPHLGLHWACDITTGDVCVVLEVSAADGLSLSSADDEVRVLTPSGLIGWGYTSTFSVCAKQKAARRAS